MDEAEDPAKSTNLQWIDDFYGNEASQRIERIADLVNKLESDLKAFIQIYGTKDISVLVGISPLDLSRLMETGEMFSNLGRKFIGWGRSLSLSALQEIINSGLAREYVDRKDESSYEIKTRKVRDLNDYLREASIISGGPAAIAHPEAGEPCILYAIASRDGHGRYTLENRLTKKRSGSYRSLFDLLPLKLVPDIPRKEGVIERRKKQADQPQSKPRRKKKDQ